MTFDRAQLERDFRAMIGPLCEAVAPTGFEDEAEALVRALLSDTQGLTYETDDLHNLIVHRPGKGPKVAVVAHLDEIGLIVRHIDDRGFLWIETLAGVQPQQLFGKHVVVKTETGHVDGLVNHINPGRPAPCADMPQTLADFFVDVGASSRAEAEPFSTSSTVRVTAAPADWGSGSDWLPPGCSIRLMSSGSGRVTEPALPSGSSPWRNSSRKGGSSRRTPSSL